MGDLESPIVAVGPGKHTLADIDRARVVRAATSALRRPLDGGPCDDDAEIAAWGRREVVVPSHDRHDLPRVVACSLARQAVAHRQSGQNTYEFVPHHSISQVEVFSNV
jgi:hypothetical protein